MSANRRSPRGTCAAFGTPILILLMALVTTPGVAPVAAYPKTVGTAGHVIATQKRAAGWRQVVHGIAIDYWTKGPRGQTLPASGALLLPAGHAPSGGWPMVAYTHGTTGYGPACGGQSQPDAKADIFISRLIAMGYAVVAPDYVGLGRFDTGVHPYLNIFSEAAATIDLLTAARSTEPTLSDSWAVLGGSQGGQAALATAHLHSEYGPESDFRGTVSIDPESDVEAIMGMLGPYIPPAPPLVEGAYNFLISVLAALRAANPAVNVNSYLSRYGRHIVDQVGKSCHGPNLPAGTALGSLLSKPLGTPAMRAALDRYMRVPTSDYDRPILLALNTTDYVVPSPLHAKLVADFSANRVDHRVVTGVGEHGHVNAQQQSAIERFLRAQLG